MQCCLAPPILSFSLSAFAWRGPASTTASISSDSSFIFLPWRRGMHGVTTSVCDCDEVIWAPGHQRAEEEGEEAWTCIRRKRSAAWISWFFGRTSKQHPVTDRSADRHVALALSLSHHHRYDGMGDSMCMQGASDGLSVVRAAAALILPPYTAAACRLPRGLGRIVSHGIASHHSGGR